jgi:hypothetical protein
MRVQRFEFDGEEYDPPMVTVVAFSCREVVAAGPSLTEPSNMDSRVGGLWELSRTDCARQPMAHQTHRPVERSTVAILGRYMETAGSWADSAA